MHSVRVRGRRILVTEMAPTRTRYEFETPNAAGERLTAELVVCSGPLFAKWRVAGLINEAIATWWHLDTEVTDPNGLTSDPEGLNPTVITVLAGTHENPVTGKLEDSWRDMIDFDWVLEAISQNAYILLAELADRFYARKGEGVVA